MNISPSSKQLLEKISKNVKHVTPKKIEEILGNKLYVSIPIILPKLITNTNTKIIDEIPPEGIILSQSGKYKFKNDIVWNPTNEIAITITTNDIVLDMDNHILSCNSNNINKTIAIYGNGIKNIKIINGTLLNFSYKGIDIHNYSNIKINNIIVDGLSWNTLGDPNSNTPVGIFLNKGHSSSIKHSTIKNINVRTDSSAAFQVVESNGVIIYKSRVENYINNDGSVQGFSLILSENCKVIKCKSKQLQSFFNGNIFTAGHTVLGFIPIFCNKLVFYKCKAENLFGCCDDVHGMSIFLNTNIIVDRFYANNVVDGVTTDVGAKATGLEIYGSDIKVYNSCVKNIKAINPQDRQATGFSCAMGSNIVIDNCISRNVIVTNEKDQKSLEFGFGIGFGWAPDPREEFTFPIENVLYTNCKAQNCQVGFDSWYHIDSVWDNLNIINCDIAILNEGDSTRTYVCSGCSECIVPLETTLTNVAKGNNFSCIDIMY